MINIQNERKWNQQTCTLSAHDKRSSFDVELTRRWRPDYWKLWSKMMKELRLRDKLIYKSTDHGEWRAKKMRTSTNEKWLHALTVIWWSTNTSVTDWLQETAKHARRSRMPMIWTCDDEAQTKLLSANGKATKKHRRRFWMLTDMTWRRRRTTETRTNTDRREWW